MAALLEKQQLFAAKVAEKGRQEIDSRELQTVMDEALQMVSIDFLEIAGELGVAPDGRTLRELWLMAEGRRRDRWAHTGRARGRGDQRRQRLALGLEPGLGRRGDRAGRGR